MQANHMFVPLIGFEERYSISPKGEVFSHLRNKIRKNQINHGGYPVIGLQKDGRLHWFAVHVLVAKQFIGPRPERMTINHKDGNKTNYAVENLEYITLSENIRHAYSLGLIKMGRRPANARFKNRQVRAIRKRYAKGHISMLNLSIQYKTTRSEIHRIVHHHIYKTA